MGRRSHCSSSTLENCELLERILNSMHKCLKSVGQASFSADEVLAAMPLLEPFSTQVFLCVMCYVVMFHTF